MHAEDGDGALGARIARANDLVEHVEAGATTPAGIALRGKVLTDQVDRAPTATPVRGRSS